MIRRRITFAEGYRMLRHLEVDWISSVFMASVWVIRGDKIEVES